MAVYQYKAKNLKGEEESGVMIADSPSQLAKQLREKGYFLISFQKSSTQKKGLKSLTSFFRKFVRIKLSEKLFFTRNLEVMIRTGVPLPQAFEILAQQVKSEKFKKALREIGENITKGNPLSESLALFPGIFPSIYRETLKVGEETGKIEDSLQILATQMEREYNLKSKVKAAMVYPVMVLSFTFMIGIFMMYFAVPKLKEAFEQLNVELPLTTRTILAFADFLTKKWPLALSLFLGLAVILLVFLKSKKTGRFKSTITLKIPIFSKLVRQTNSALALRTLSSLLKAGVPIVRSLEVASGALNNFYFRKSLKEAAKVVEKGKKLSFALQPYQDLYSPMVLQMIKVGEETGATGEVLTQLAEFYEQEVLTATQKISSVIEPLLIILIGSVVGFFAFSMFQPLFSIMGAI